MTKSSKVVSMRARARGEGQKDSKPPRARAIAQAGKARRPTATEARKYLSELTERERAFVAARCRGRSRVNAVRDAGYRASNSGNASSIGLRIEGKVRDLGLLDEALARAGFDQLAIAKTLAAAVKSKTMTSRLKAVEIGIRLLGYDKPRDYAGKLPDVDVDAILSASFTLGRALQSATIQRTAQPGPGGAETLPGQ